MKQLLNTKLTNPGSSEEVLGIVVETKVAHVPYTVPAYSSC